MTYELLSLAFFSFQVSHSLQIKQWMKINWHVSNIFLKFVLHFFIICINYRMVNKICYLYIQLILTYLKQDFVSYQDPFSSNHKFPVIFFSVELKVCSMVIKVFFLGMITFLKYIFYWIRMNLWLVKSVIEVTFHLNKLECARLKVWIEILMGFIEYNHYLNEPEWMLADNDV